MLRFNALREATRYEPRRLRLFYSQSATIKEAADELFSFMFWGKLEGLVEHGNRIHVGLPDGFRPAYDDYKQRWRDVLDDVAGFRARLGDEFASASPPATVPTEPPDYAHDESFDPRLHNAGKVMDAGIGYLADKADDASSDDYIRNLSRIAVEGSDYIAAVVGIDLSAVSERFRRIPVTFVPSHVSPGTTEPSAGNLVSLLNEAILAYVAGAPNASIAMCRAILERLLKTHYGRGEEDDQADLKDQIDFCAKHYAWVAREKKPLHELRRLANKMLHAATAGSRVSADDEVILIRAFANLKFLIEKAPRAKS